jgi:exodeoxyribonuclease-1
MTFYFYDLETSGINPRADRVMQFAGQRVDLDLKPVGEPDNILIKMTPDTLPQPEAILITGITPQQTLTDGITEVEFLKYFADNVATPDTIIVGYNNVRFDDEFIRFMLWRNFYDAYEWQWKDGCSRWDLLDMVRMTRALRPDGIKWAFASDGKPSNRLELLSDLNKLKHVSAHDALSDVEAAIEVARLIKNKQPKLFDYLLNVRTKHKTAALVDSGQPFIYTSGRYPSSCLHTTAASKLIDYPDRQGALVYDLRDDPDEFIKMPPAKLAELWSARGKDVPYFPVKALFYNKCPAIAPLSVLDDKSAERLNLPPTKINENIAKLKAAKDFGPKLVEALKLMQKPAQPSLVVDPQKVDAQLYDGFIGNEDKDNCRVVRAAKADELSDLNLKFKDDRLTALLPLYKARNFPSKLSPSETEAWDKFKTAKLAVGGDNSLLNQYFAKLNQLASREGISDGEKYILEELNLYGQSISPSA